MTDGHLETPDGRCPKIFHCCAIVAMGYLDHTANRMIGFPLIKAVPRKLPVALSADRSAGYYSNLRKIR